MAQHDDARPDLDGPRVLLPHIRAVCPFLFPLLCSAPLCRSVLAVKKNVLWGLAGSPIALDSNLLIWILNMGRDCPLFRRYYVFHELWEMLTGGFKEYGPAQIHRTQIRLQGPAQIHRTQIRLQGPAQIHCTQINTASRPHPNTSHPNKYGFKAPPKCMAPNTASRPRPNAWHPLNLCRCFLLMPARYYVNKCMG